MAKRSKPEPKVRNESKGRERISVEAVAAILGLAARTIRDLANRGDIPGAGKFGRRWTFDEARLREFVRKKETDAGQTERAPRKAAAGRKKSSQRRPAKSAKKRGR